MKIIKQYDKTTKHFSKSGNGYLTPHYEWVLDKTTNTRKYVKVSETDLDQVIQANAKNYDLKTIMQQLQCGIKVANEGIYCDTTQLPTNIHEAGAMHEKLNSIYEENPILKKIYKTKEDYSKAFIDRKVEEDINEFYNKEIKKINDKAISDYKKSITAEANRKKEINKIIGENK